MRPLKLRHMRPPRPPCLSNRVSLLGCVLYDIYVPLLGFAQLLSGACKLVVLGVVPQVVALSPSLRYDGMFAMFLLPSDSPVLLFHAGGALCADLTTAVNSGRDLASGFFEVRASSRVAAREKKKIKTKKPRTPLRARHPSPTTRTTLSAYFGVVPVDQDGTTCVKMYFKE